MVVSQSRQYLGPAVLYNCTAVGEADDDAAAMIGADFPDSTAERMLERGLFSVQNTMRLPHLIEAHLWLRSTSEHKR